MEKQSPGQIRRLTSSLHPIPSVSRPGPAPLRQLPADTAYLHLLESKVIAACGDVMRAGSTLPTLGSLPPTPSPPPAHRTRPGQERAAEAATPHPE